MASDMVSREKQLSALVQISDPPRGPQCRKLVASADRAVSEG